MDDRPARAAAPGGDLGDVGEEKGVEAVQGRERQPGNLGQGGAQHPQPHRRRHRRHRQQVGGELTVERGFFEVKGDQRCRRERRGDGDGGALGQGRRQGAEPPPRPSRAIADRGRRPAIARMPRTAAKLSCQPTSAPTRGSIGEGDQQRRSPARRGGRRGARQTSPAGSVRPSPRPLRSRDRRRQAGRRSRSRRRSRAGGRAGACRGVPATALPVGRAAPRSARRPPTGD